MEQMKEAQACALQGEVAAAGLAAARAQIAAWGLTMPPVTPLVFDFGLGDFARVGEIEFWIANELEAGYCAKFLFVADGQTCPLHLHAKKHETFYLVKGRLTVEFAGGTRELGEGAVLPVPPDTLHSFTGSGGPALLLEVSMPSVVADNFFADQRVPIGGGPPGESRRL